MHSVINATIWCGPYDWPASINCLSQGTKKCTDSNPSWLLTRQHLKMSKIHSIYKDLCHRGQITQLRQIGRVFFTCFQLVFIYTVFKCGHFFNSRSWPRRRNLVKSWTKINGEERVCEAVAKRKNIFPSELKNGSQKEFKIEWNCHLLHPAITGPFIRNRRFNRAIENTSLEVQT